MRFENPEYLILLAIIPLMFLLRWAFLSLQKRSMMRWGDENLTRQQMPDVSKYRPLIKFSLMMVAVALLIVMIARPQMGTKISDEKRKGIEAIICLDISNSMMANDVSPTRLDKSKLLVQNLVEHFNNDKIGLVVFAGDAFTQLPITSDYVSAKMFLDNANPNLIREQGTDIGKAIDIASQSFTKKDKVGRAVIIITDGENHEEGTLEAAKQAAADGLQVFVLGVGSAKGSKIPLADGTFMKDNAGNDVVTALNEQMCREIAEAGKGTYIHVDNTGDAQKKLDDALSNVQRSEISSVIYSEYAEQFQIFGIIVLLIIIAEIFVMERKTKLQRRISLFNRKPKNKTLAIIVMLMFIPLTLSAQVTDRDYIRHGNRYYRSGNFQKAVGEYQKAIGKNKNNIRAHYNLGCANMQMADKTDELNEKLKIDSIAVEAFLGCTTMPEATKLQKAHAYHNIGIIYHKHYYVFDELAKHPEKYQGLDQNAQAAAQQMRHSSLVEAIKAYRFALRNNPKDDETRYNLALCQYLLSKEPKSPQQQNQQNKNEQQKKDDKKDQDDKQNKQDKDKQKQQKQQKEGMSKENAQQMLLDAKRKEQEIQKRRKAAPAAARPMREKNW